MFNYFKATANFAFRIGQGLAMFQGNQFGKFGGVFTHQMLQFQHDAHAGTLAAIAPGFEGFLGIGNRLIHFIKGGKGNPCNHFLVGRIHHIAPDIGRGADFFTIDNQGDFWDGAHDVILLLI